ECTYFTMKEIKRLYKRFMELSLLYYSPTELKKMSRPTLPPHIIATMAELKVNPFADRIIHVFSDDVNGCMTFEGFLNMFSVFNEQAPRDVKAFYAFRIYDFDGDQYLEHGDLLRTLERITRRSLKDEEAELIITKVLEEAEMDDDMKISFMEFEHVLSRAPDFLSTFHIRV
uniref:EF-hand domain-containing protein n=2 Tax=Ciona intestinalis TaxID=7719 RepID=H2XNX1_CIOIN